MWEEHKNAAFYTVNGVIIEKYKDIRKEILRQARETGPNTFFLVEPYGGFAYK